MTGEIENIIARRKAHHPLDAVFAILVEQLDGVVLMQTHNEHRPRMGFAPWRLAVFRLICGEDRHRDAMPFPVDVFDNVHMVVFGGHDITIGRAGKARFDGNDVAFAFQCPHTVYAVVPRPLGQGGGQVFFDLSFRRPVSLYIVENALKFLSQAQIAHLADFLFRQIADRFAAHHIADLKLAPGAVFRRIAHRAIGRVFMQLPLDAMIRTVTDNTIRNCRVYLFCKPFIGVWNRSEYPGDIFIRLIRRRRAGDFFHHGTVNDADDASVNGVMAIIVAVLAIMVRQAQPPFIAQLAGQPSGRHPHVHFGLVGGAGVELSHIGRGQPGEMPGFIELAVEERRLALETVHGVRFEPPAFVRRHRRCAGDHGVQIEVIAIVFRRLGRAEGALEAVGAPHGNGFIGNAVIQRARARKDMLDLNLIGNQPPEADLFTGIGAAPVRRRLRQLLPQPHALEIFADLAVAFGDQTFLQEFLTPALIGGAIEVVAFGGVLFLLLRLFQIARQLQDDLIRPAMACNQRVDDAAQLVQANMHAGVGDPAKPDLIGIVRVPRAEADMAL